MGTLDEITEVMTYKRLGLLGKINKPVMIYNVNGYYDRLFGFLDDMRSSEFCRQYDRDFVIEVKSIEDIEKALESAGAVDGERNSKYD
jgi:predicted Rossmann-fold nucleotide-binding protein